MLLVEAMLLSGGAIARRPDLTANESFLFGDQSLNILIADRLLAGERLYSGIFTPYGPLAPYLHAAFAAVFGNGILVYNLLLLLLTLANVALAYALVRSRTSSWVAVAVVGVGLAPSFLIPGSLLGGFTVSPYVPLERGLLLAAALAWVPPGERTTRRAAVLGAILGSWQWVKFGGGIFAGAAILVLDAVVLAGRREGGALVRPWLRGFGVALAAFGVLELARVALAYLLLPAEIAFDVVWPAYHLETYRSWVTEEERWIAWGGWRLFIGQYLTPFVGAILLLAGLAALGRGIVRRKGVTATRAGDLRLLLPALFFLVGMFGYLQQAHIIRQFLWTLVISSALLLLWWGRGVAIGVTLLWLPCFLLNARAMLVTAPDPGLVRVELPTGDRPTTAPQVAEQVAGVLDRVGSLRVDRALQERIDPAAVPILFVPMGAGFHAFFDIATAGRQPWHIPGFTRAYDERELREAADRLGAIVVQEPAVAANPPASACAWFDPSPFSDDLCSVLDPLLGEPERVGSDFVVYPIRAAAGQGLYARSEGGRE